MITYANPLYDTVFKYLIEDLDIARELLSIILEVKVVDLVVQSQEVSTAKRQIELQDNETDTNRKTKRGNPKTLLRYDFRAVIEQPNGQRKTILLELQKRNQKSNVFRFRNYLGRNYMTELDKQPFEQKYIYLLGFPLDYTQNVPSYLWCRRQLIDGLTGDLFFSPNEINFVERITHEACFIHVNGFQDDDPHPVSQVMNLFNQKRKTESDYFLSIAPPKKGTLMARIVDRLYKASQDEELLKAMELEAYYEYDIQGLEDDMAVLQSEKEEAVRKQEEAVRKQEEERLQKEEAVLKQEEERLQKEEAKKQLKASAKLLAELGLSAEDISTKLGLPLNDVFEMLK